MKFKVTLEFEVELDPASDDALIAEEGSIETAAIQLAHEHLCSGGHGERVIETKQEAERIS